MGDVLEFLKQGLATILGRFDHREHAPFAAPPIHPYHIVQIGQLAAHGVIIILGGAAVDMDRQGRAAFMPEPDHRRGHLELVMAKEHDAKAGRRGHGQFPCEISPRSCNCRQPSKGRDSGVRRIMSSCNRVL